MKTTATDEHHGWIDGTGVETWAMCSRGWLGDKRSKIQGGAEAYQQAVKDLTEHMGGECKGDGTPSTECECGGYIAWQDMGDGRWEGSCYGKCGRYPVVVPE